MLMADNIWQPHLKMLLASDRAEHQGLPKEYELDLMNSAVENHFVFTEEDLPGFKARSKARQKAADAGIPMSILKQKTDKPAEKPTYEKRGRYQPYYRKAIPSPCLRFRGQAYGILTGL
jgi:transcription initiation factor TFIIF subunit beta